MAGQQTLAAMFRAGNEKIATARTGSLFHELQGRELTEDEQRIIAERTAHQREMLAAYERRERARKVGELRAVVPGLQEVEAGTALDLCGGDEEEAVGRMVGSGSAAFLRRVREAAGTLEAFTAQRQQQQQQQQAAAAPKPKPPGRAVQPLKLDSAVFAGAFKGKLMGKDLGNPKTSPRTPVEMPKELEPSSPEKGPSPTPLPVAGEKGKRSSARRRPREKPEDIVKSLLAQPPGLKSGKENRDARGEQPQKASTPGKRKQPADSQATATADTVLDCPQVQPGGTPTSKKQRAAASEPSPSRAPVAPVAPAAPAEVPMASPKRKPARKPPLRKPRLGRVRQKGSKKAELVEVGTVRFTKGWHNQGYIFPEGYFARTLFRSSVMLDQVCVHECRVLGEGAKFWPGPTFRIIALDRPEEVLDAKSPTGCWNAVLKRINNEILDRIAKGHDLPRPPKTAIAGPEYFGFINPDVVEKIEAQDPERRCTLYWEGKEDRRAYGAADPLTLLRAQEKALSKTSRPRERGGSSKPSRAQRQREREERLEFEEEEEEDTQCRGNAWNGVNRSARYAARCEQKGEGAPQIPEEDDNPLPDMLDPITLERVEGPAISPFGHVMGFATWQTVLREQDGVCPFTKKPLTIERVKKLTKSNIEMYREDIINLG